MTLATNTIGLLRRIQITSNFKKLHTLRSLGSTARMHQSNGSTVDPQEIEQHAKMVREWWDPDGPMKALHTYNLIRVPFIRDGLIDMCPKTILPLQGKKILDVGCGGGILSEPLARLGAKVTGIDASMDLIRLATDHAAKDKKLDYSMPQYYCTTIEEHAATNAQVYDGVVASEIIEHVNNKELFVQSCVQTLKLGGRIFFTTPNRTKLAQLGVIYLAEYMFRLVPKGTHQFEKFMTPLELKFMLERNNCVVELTHGVMYNFLTNRWSWSSSQAFAYVLQAVRTH